MFSTAKDDDMVECPYNKYHQMLRRRLIPHLIKCRLSYPDAELIKCPFNASHLIPEPEFTHHVNNCKDKAIIHQYKYNTLPVKIDEEDRQQVEIECDENWDDTEAVDYDPKKYVSQANVIRTHIGDLPSVRKEFRKSERKRLGDEDSSDDEAQKTFGKRVYKDMDCKKKEEARENNWFEDRGPSSSSKKDSQRRDSFEKSLKEFSKERGHGEDYNTKIIKQENDGVGEKNSNKGPKDVYPEKESSRSRSREYNARDESSNQRSKDAYSGRRRRESSRSKSREHNVRDESSNRRSKDDYSGRRRRESSRSKSREHNVRDESSNRRSKDDYSEKRRGEYSSKTREYNDREEYSNRRSKDDYRDRRGAEDESRRKRGEDDDPYYKSHNSRHGYIGMSNRARRGRY